MRLKFVVAYDGTDFCGWAAQSGQRTVQQTLTEAIRQVSGQSCTLWSASRTDSGAHARGQVCHFDTEVGIESKKWPRILNKVLPPDVAVQSAETVPDDFSSRFWVLDRWYRYRIRTSTRDPFEGRYAHEYGQALDLNLMQSAAEKLVGEHDFRAFTEELDQGVLNTRRELYKIELTQQPDEIWIDIVGTAFLRGMMRRISGALLEVGRRHRPVSDIDTLLSDRRGETQWPVVLPAKGLCLMEVRYPDPLRSIR